MTGADAKKIPVQRRDKRQLEPPSLKRFGDLRQLTRSFAGRGPDSMPMVNMSRP